MANRAAVLGSPIAHSKSPLLHQAAYRALGLDWEYERHEVQRGGLAEFVAEHPGYFRGLSLTMPLKEDAYALAEVRSDAVLATEACNTLVFGDRIYGYNTDVTGFLEALRHASVDIPERVTIIGAGATARAAGVAMAQHGVAGITVLGRRPEAVAEFAHWLSALGPHAQAADWNSPLDDPLILSTTPAGATDGLAVPKRPGVLFDVVYAPWPTALAAKWQAADGRVLGGLELLIHQAAEQVLLMTGVPREQRSTIVAAMYAAIA